MKFPIDSLEMIGLYLFLKDHEQLIDDRLQRLLRRLEGQLYEHLSIEEIEDLPNLYGKNIDVIREKG